MSYFKEHDFSRSEAIIAHFKGDIKDSLTSLKVGPLERVELISVTGGGFHIYIEHGRVIFSSSPNIYSFPLHPCSGEDVFKNFMETDELEILKDSAGEVICQEDRGYAFYGKDEPLIHPRAYWALQVVKKAILELGLTRTDY